MSKELYKATEEGTKIAVKTTKETAVLTSSTVIEGVKVTTTVINHTAGAGRVVVSAAGKILKMFNL